MKPQKGYVYDTNFDGPGLKAINEMILMLLFQYGTKSRGDRSGAYLFMPDGEATVIQTRSPLVRIVEGKVLSYVEVHTNWGIHKVSLMSSPGKNTSLDTPRDNQATYDTSIGFYQIIDAFMEFSMLQAQMEPAFKSTTKWIFGK